jgi:hypothetical protein
LLNLTRVVSTSRTLERNLMITDALHGKRPANEPIPGSTRDIARTALEAARKATKEAFPLHEPVKTRKARVSPLRTAVYLLTLFVEGFKSKTSKRACKRLAWHLGGVGAVTLFIVSPYTLGTIMAVMVCLIPFILTWRLATWKTRRKARKNA